MFELSKMITKVFIMIFFRMFPSGQGRVRFMAVTTKVCFNLNMCQR